MGALRTALLRFANADNRNGLRSRAYQAYRSPIARNTKSIAFAQGLRIVSQALYFVVLARSLTPAGFGAFAAAAGLIAIVTPFAHWGAGEILLQRVSRSRDTVRQEWAHALSSILRNGSLALIGASLASYALLPNVPFTLLICVGIAEFWFGGAVIVGSQIYQAMEHGRRMGHAWLILSMSRLLGALAMAFLSTTPEVTQWAIVYLLTSGVAAGAVIALINREIGTPNFGHGPVGRDRINGFMFAIGISSASLSADIGKVTLSKLDSLTTTGTYAAADRVINVAFIPVLALLSSSYPRLHRAGSDGPVAAFLETARLLPLALLYSVLAIAGVYVIAPMLEVLLGGGYEAVTQLVRWLAALIMLRTLSLFAANALTASGHLHWRSACQLCAAALCVAGSFLAIPAFGWRGAAVAAVLAEAFSVLSLWTVLSILAIRHTKGRKQHR